jgi:IS30 family transposase
MPLEGPHDEGTRVSQESIYQSLSVQGRGRLRRELTRCLRSGPTKRKPDGTGNKSGPVANMGMIGERPAEAHHRAVPGHWEGDLLIGKGGASAVGTLVEKTTRTLLLSSPASRSWRTRRRNSDERSHRDPAGTTHEQPKPLSDQNPSPGEQP